MQLQSTPRDGAAEPLGATWTGAGVNFAVFSRHADSVEVCLFDAAGTTEQQRFTLSGRSGDIHHGFIPTPTAGIGTLYGLRAHGPFAPRDGHRFNHGKLLLDPCARAIVGELRWNESLFGHSRADPEGLTPELRDSAADMPRCRVIDTSFDWEDDRAPATQWRDTVIYELHVKGHTQLHPDVPPEWRGKFLGLTVPGVIEHIRSLGVTAVELMPVHSFTSEGFLRERGLTNYWGYNSLGWFSLAQQYAVSDPVVEFKLMVRALHRAGLEVIMDVVYNHTPEGDEHGPTLSWRGLDNRVYYALRPTERRHYENMTGCGNTIAADQPAVQATILASLRYFAEEMRVDGFRFDLAPVLARDRGGFNANAPFFAALRADPVLAYVKLIAEPWDVGHGGYQLGNFPAGWSEWNDRYRDTLRATWRGDRRLLGSLAERIAGSSDLFRRHGRKPTASINFVASHDGFTLRDVVSYNERHNETNMERNHDGHADNLSWNCGVEGPTDDESVLRLRDRQVRNLLATLFVSQGVPMLLAGDEFGRTQRGNNNAYCQDNEISWIDWSLARASTLPQFVGRLAQLRRSAPQLRRDTFLKGSIGHSHSSDVMWLHPHGRELSEHDWHDPQLRSLAVFIAAAGASSDLLVLINASDSSTEFHVPPAGAAQNWSVFIDTAAPSDQASAVVSSDRAVILGPHHLLILQRRED